MTEMARKVNLSRAMRTMQELFPEEYNFYPRSWILPEEFAIFLTEVNLMKENNPRWKPTFIVKPDGGCQGDGIYLVKDPTEIRLVGNLQSRPAVVQEYMSKPFLIDKLKFDIRLGNFVHSDSGNTGSKRTFSSILGKLSSGGVNVRKVWSDIVSLVIKTVIAIVPELKVFYQSDIPAGKPGPSCFQILGFDILLMKNLKPILLEVNANPSMKIEHEQEVSPGVMEYVPSPVDEEVKVAIIRDTLRLVDPHKKQQQQRQELGEQASAEPVEVADKDSFLEEELQNEPELGESPPPEAEPPALCLKEVFPKYAKQFSYLRLVERIAALFLRFLGVKGTTKLGPTGFRTFIRNSKISNSGFSMAAGDILYIDITRRGIGPSTDQREAGMSLPAFVEAVCFLAQRRYKSLSLHEQVELLLDFCEYNLAVLDEKRLACSRSLSGTRATLVTCPQDRLQLSPSTPGSAAFQRSQRFVDCRSCQL
ncbi:tubulin polyglutamylase TTLL11 isoform 2-T2 [Vipera latastei]